MGVVNNRSSAHSDARSDDNEGDNLISPNQLAGNLAVRIKENLSHRALVIEIDKAIEFIIARGTARTSRRSDLVGIVNVIECYGVETRGRTGFELVPAIG